MRKLALGLLLAGLLLGGPAFAQDICGLDNSCVASDNGAFMANPFLGTTGGTQGGSLGFAGATSGSVTIAPQAAAGTAIALTLPNTAGTLADGASAPLVLSATTGNLTLTTPLSAAYGGTGVANNTANTITFSGNYGLTWTLTGTTSLTLPASGTLVNSNVTTLSSLTSVGTIGTGVWNGTAVAPGYGGTGSAKGALSVWGCNIPDTAALNTNYCIWKAANTALVATFFDDFTLSYNSTCTTYPVIEIYDITQSTALGQTTVPNTATTITSVNASAASAAAGDTYGFRVTTAGSACSSTLATEFIGLTASMRN